MARPIKSVNIRGKRWRVVDSSKLRGIELGYCTNPALEREIAIPVDGDTKEELNTTVHEVVHACDWDLSEEAVEEIATSVTDVIWLLKWRKED